MFKVEQAVADWRRHLRAAGVKAPGVLDELESHLRDDIDTLLRTGLTEEQAFETATTRIGDVQKLKSEFTSEQRLKRAVLVAAMVLYALVSSVPVILKLGSFSDVNAAQQRSALAAVAVTVIGFFGGWLLGRILPGVSKRLLLTLTGAGLALLFAWLLVFYHRVMTYVEWDLSRLVVAILWAIVPVSFFSILHGMEEASFGRTPKTNV